MCFQLCRYLAQNPEENVVTNLSISLVESELEAAKAVLDNRIACAKASFLKLEILLEKAMLDFWPFTKYGKCDDAFNFHFISHQVQHKNPRLTDQLFISTEESDQESNQEDGQESDQESDQERGQESDQEYDQEYLDTQMVESDSSIPEASLSDISEQRYLGEPTSQDERMFIDFEESVAPGSISSDVKTESPEVRGRGITSLLRRTVHKKKATNPIH